VYEVVVLDEELHFLMSENAGSATDIEDEVCQDTDTLWMLSVVAPMKDDSSHVLNRGDKCLFVQ